MIIFHLGAKWLPGGFVGVDVFFVISGYLISSIILKEQAQNTFTLKNFWLRRVRRIMPAMLLMLLASLVAAYFVEFSASWHSLGLQSISTLMLSANMLLWHLTHDYWGPAAETLPLLHNWSLSVEEQFYLFYPLILVACLKWFPKKLLLCLGSIFFVSLALSILATLRFPSAAFYFLPTRAWELAGGCFLAAMTYRTKNPSASLSGLAEMKPFSGWVGNSLTILGIVLIGASWLLINDSNFPGYKALMPVIGTMLMLQFAGGKNCIATSLLASPPLRYIGSISYSLYLWHWPVIVLGRAVQVRWDFPDYIYMALIPLFAITAYYWVEVPGRRLVNILPPVSIGVGIVTLVSAGFIFFKPTFNLSQYAPTVWVGNAYDVAPDLTQQESIKARMEGITQINRDPQYANAYERNGIIKRYGSERIDVLVLGNSHALMWAPVLDEICQESKLSVLFYIADGVPPFPSIPAQKKSVTVFSPEQWFVFDSNRIKFIKELRPRLVIIASRWSAYTLTDDAKNFVAEVCNQNGKVLFIEDPPELITGDINTPKFVAATHATTIKAHYLKELQDSTAQLQSLSDTYKCCDTLITADLYLTNLNRVKVMEGNSILYIDDDHLSVAGTRLAKGRIKAKLVDLLEWSIHHELN